MSLPNTTGATGGSLWIDEFRTSYRDLLRFLRRRTRCDETAQDLAQDAWLRVAAQPRPGGPAASSDHARAYLFTVAERLAIDHLRRQRLWQDELAPRLSAATGQTPDVAESHAYGQALRAVDAALAALPQRTREVFIAHRLEGVPHDELALRFQVSRKTIEREITGAMDSAQAALGAEPGITERRGRRKAMGALLGLAGIGTPGVLAWQLWRDAQPQWQTAFATQTGQVDSLALPDGSVVTLDAQSAADIQLFGLRREVRLSHGSAFFAVARDAARPFVVQAGDTRVTVLGTRFAVEMDADGVRVAVESGRVAVQCVDGGADVELGSGEVARITGGSAPQRLALPAGAEVAGWRSGWLDFDRVSLGAAAARLNRYRTGAPVLVDPAVAALPVFARVHIPRSTQWLQGLPAVLPVSVTVAADGGVRIAPR